LIEHQAQLSLRDIFLERLKSHYLLYPAVWRTEYYSLFRMFTAFKNYSTIINNIRQNTFFPEELRKHIRVYPGSLTELKDKIDIILKQGEESPSKVYRWFLANEFNLLINKVRKIYINSADKDRFIPIRSMLSPLKVSYRIKTNDEDTLNYLEYLKNKCGYKKT
jgi:hypothetical protein